jgi:hypothetical protein
MAATVTGRETHYFPFGDSRVARLAEIVEAGITRGWKVGQVFEALLDIPLSESLCFDYLLKYLD